MKPSSALRAWVFVAAGAALFAQEKPADNVVELPKFVVTDNRELPQPESWRYATIPGFEILTNASDRATRRLISDFDQFRQALSYVWPVPDRISQTTSLIISGKGAKFDAFVPEGRRVPDAGFASLFLKERDKTAIVIDLESTTLNVLNIDGADDAATGTDSGQISVDHHKQLYREYVRYLLSRSEPRQPAWLEEGLAQIIMKMEFDRRWIEFAKVEDPNTVSALGAMTAELNALSAAEDPEASMLPGAPAEDRDFNVALRRRRLIDMDKFFAITHDAPEALNVLGNNRWAKQAYAFVHMCLYGEKGKYQKAFGTFLRRLAKEPVSEKLFQECFNQTYKQMLMSIRTYCDFTYFEAQSIRSKKGGPDLIVAPPQLELREATQSEIGRIKGEALVLAGHKAKARTELIAPYMRGERDPQLLAALGIYERNAGETERARKFLEAAFAGKATRPDACLELGRLRYADAVAKPGAADGLFSAAQVKAIVEPLLVGRRQPPHTFAIYDLLADTWARSAVKPKREDVTPLIEGGQLFPTRLKLIFQAGALAAEAGELQPAHAFIDHGIAYAPDATVKKRFQDLKASIPPAPPAASAAPATPAPAAAASGKS